ncbi:hypothetical protein QP178_16050 [Sphingomonas aurantiaca]|uniref:hypothetical protein n=1 Tax=Sphingomonas aurantiaca TaxID=185949 RepID=UPI002FDF9707
MERDAVAHRDIDLAAVEIEACVGRDELGGDVATGGRGFSFCAPTSEGADVASRASVIVVKALNRIVILTVFSQTVVARFGGWRQHRSHRHPDESHDPGLRAARFLALGPDFRQDDGRGAE